MKRFVVEVVTIACVASLSSASESNAVEDIFKIRRDRVKSVCSKYDDPLKYGYSALHKVESFEAGGTTVEDLIDHMVDKSKPSPNPVDNIFFCQTSNLSPRTSIGNLLLPAIQFRGTHTKEEESERRDALEKYLEGKEGKGKSYLRAKEGGAKGITITVHPFKLISWAHTEMYLANDWSKKYRHALDWLKGRKDKFLPVGHDKGQAQIGKDAPTFRQTVNLLTKCVAEHLPCQDVIKSVMQIRPMWMDCPPCVPGVETSHFIIDLDNADAEVDTLLKELSIERSELKEENEITTEPLSEYIKKVQGFYNANIEKNFSQLTKQEIYELYQRYKLDFELYGYSPDEYIAMGMDA